MMEDGTSRPLAKGSREAVGEVNTATTSPEQKEKAVTRRRASSGKQTEGEKDEVSDDNDDGDEDGVPDEDPNAKYVTKVRPNDVMLGRGTGPNNNAGNVVFRTVVEKLKQPYLSTPSRIKKRQLVRKAVETVKGKNGRFLSRLKKSEIKRLGLLHPEDPVLGRIASSMSSSYKKSANTNSKGLRKVVPVYEVVEDDVAMEKTKQALRYICYKKDNPRRNQSKEEGEGGDSSDDGNESSVDIGDDESAALRRKAAAEANANVSSDGEDPNQDATTSKTDDKEGGHKAVLANPKSHQKKRRRTLSSSSRSKRKGAEATVKARPSPVAASRMLPQHRLPQALPEQLGDMSQRFQHQQEEALLARSQNVHHSLLSSYMVRQPSMLAASLPTNATATADLLREHLLASAAAAASAVYDPHILAATTGGAANAAAAARLAALQQYYPSAAVGLSSLLNQPADPFIAAALRQEQYLAASTARQRAQELALGGTSSLFNSSQLRSASLDPSLNSSDPPTPSLPLSSDQRRTSDSSTEASRMDTVFRGIPR